jgi:hypothetical protein
MSRNPNTDIASGQGWLSFLNEEADLLERLSKLAQDARKNASFTGSETFRKLLSEQAEVCQTLEGLRAQREALLEGLGHSPKELLVVVLGATEPQHHPEVVSAFGRLMDAAESAQHEIDLNRHFFEAALATVEGTIDTVSRAAGTGAQTYDASGIRANKPAPMRVSTCA